MLMRFQKGKYEAGEKVVIEFAFYDVEGQPSYGELG